MTWWKRPLKEIKVNLQIIGSKNRNAENSDVWNHVQEMLASLQGLEESLKIFDEKTGGPA